MKNVKNVDTVERERERESYNLLNRDIEISIRKELYRRIR